MEANETLLGGGRSSQSDGKTLRLIRTSKAVKAVWGKMFLGGVSQRATTQYDSRPRRSYESSSCSRSPQELEILGDPIRTLENADYIIPDGTYPISVTFSPRFQKNLPLINKVPGRSGIRIHTGTRPEHSQGCVLVNARDKEAIIEYLTKNKQNNEETHITISSAY